MCGVSKSQEIPSAFFSPCFEFVIHKIAPQCRALVWLRSNMLSPWQQQWHESVLQHQSDPIHSHPSAPIRTINQKLPHLFGFGFSSTVRCSNFLFTRQMNIWQSSFQRLYLSLCLIMCLHLLFIFCFLIFYLNQSA